MKVGNAYIINDFSTDDVFEVANEDDKNEKVEDDPNTVTNTLRRNKVSVKDLSQQFEDQSRNSNSSIDQVVLRTRAHRFDKPQRKSSVTDSDHPEQVCSIPCQE